MMVMVKVMATKEMIKCFIFGKEEREKQKWALGKGILIGVIFGLHSRHKEFIPVQARCKP